MFAALGFTEFQWLIIVQAIGWIAMALGVIRYQMKTTHQIRLFNFFAASLWALHYAGLETWVAAVLCVIAALRSLVLLHDKIWERKKAVALTSIVLCTIVSVPFFERWIDLLPLLGLYSGSLMDIQKKAVIMRAFGFLGQGIWLVFNVLVGSQGGIANNLLNIGSNIVGVWRHHISPAQKTSFP